MKKIKQTSIILWMVSVAFMIKSFQLKNMPLLVLGILLCVFGILRMRMIDKYMKDLEDEATGEDSILRYLKKDPILYVDMIEIYQKGNCEILYDENDGILLYDHTSKYYLASALTLEGAKDIVRLLPSDYNVLVAHEQVFEVLAGKEFQYVDMLYSYNHVYETRNSYQVEEHSFTLKMLDESYIEAVKKQYTIKDLCTDEYIGARIKEGMLGAFDGDILAGFIGIHDTGAVGMLEVLPKYRGRHLGKILQQEYVNYLLANHYKGVIYGQVNAKNKISLNLQQKVNFKKAKTPMYWYFS